VEFDLPCKVSKGSLEVKHFLQTHGKAERWEESEKRRAKERRSEKKKSQKKEDAGARKGRKSRETQCFSNDLWLRRVE
jgi:ribosomal protein L9